MTHSYRVERVARVKPKRKKVKVNPVRRKRPASVRPPLRRDQRIDGA